MLKPLSLVADVEDLAGALVDIPSPSHHEDAIASALENALGFNPSLHIRRSGNAVIAESASVMSAESASATPDVIIAGHLDTVPAAGNLPHSRRDGVLAGLGACDMKGGLAVMAKLAWDMTLQSPAVRFIFYDCEEVAAEHNGLARLAREHPSILQAPFAVVMEPTNGVVEGGCQGTIRVDVCVDGRRAHSARAWHGVNAVHQARLVLEILETYEPRRPLIDGLEFREGLNAVGIRGGVAGNVIPDECVVTVNYRFAPDMSVDDAVQHLQEVFADFSISIVDWAPGARPGLTDEGVRRFVEAVGGEVTAKYGWTDVARFSEHGTPAVNYGPGDPLLAHTVDESVREEQLRSVYHRMRGWLSVDG